MLKKHLSNSGTQGAFYKIPDLAIPADNIDLPKTVFIGSLPHSDDLITLVYDMSSSVNEINDIKSEIIIFPMSNYFFIF